MGSSQRALDDAKTAVKLLNGFNTPEWHYYKPTINLQLADAHELLGDSYSSLDRHEEAQKEYEQASRHR
jgi:tetratricopeptide (TPR) repeat protein